MNILFMDDAQYRIQLFRSIMPSATIVETAAECIAEIGKEDWDVIFLDHDLGGETFVDSARKDCGMEVVRHLTDNPPTVKPRVYVHSLNRKAAAKMVIELAIAGYDTKVIPFPILADTIDEVI